MPTLHSGEPRKRFVAWLSLSKHNQLKSNLVLNGEEMSTWLERQVDRYLSDPTHN